MLSPASCTTPGRVSATLPGSGNSRSVHKRVLTGSRRALRDTAAKNNPTSQGAALRLTDALSRQNALMLSLAAGTVKGHGLLTMATTLRRSEILNAHAAACGPPLETPRASASSVTSSGQSKYWRPGLKSERPMPGRSTAMMQALTRLAVSSIIVAPSRDEGFP